MKFKTLTAPVHEVFDGDFESFVRNVYSNYISVVEAEDQEGGCVLKYTLPQQSGLTPWDREVLDGFVRGGLYARGTIGALLQDMINNHQIPAGIWIINIRNY